jgi:sugar O-acyltransferase (sialic acid O-acetyltransferase NeuD family)
METRQKIVIYGNGQMAEFAWARLGDDARQLVAGFTVDAAHLREPSLRGLPVVAFEELARLFPAESHRMFIAVGPVECNRIRGARFERARELGYRFASYLSPRAMVARDVVIGANALIGDGAIVQSFVNLGDNVHVGAGCIVGHHSVVGDHCFLAPGCVVAGSVGIGQRSFLGANATVRDRLQIGSDCVVGAGATIVRSTAPSSVHVAPEAVLLPIDSHQIRF